MMRTVWTVVCLIGMTAAVAVALNRNAQAAADDPFLKGLQDRGLTSLMEAYLRQSGAGQAPTGTTPGQPAAPAAAPDGNKAMLAAVEVQKALAAKNMKERQDLLAKARTLYEEAIDEGVKALPSVPADKIVERSRLRLQILKQRLELANLIFQKWLRTDLDILEVTDRRGGERARAAELLKAAADQYRAINSDTTQWLSEVDRFSPADRSKFVNTGYDRELRRIQREAKFDEAWVTYYLGWVLPADYKPPDKERSRKELLNDAITAFQAYATLPNTVSAKWYAHLVIAMAYRELGKFTEALQSISLADTPVKKEDDAKVLAWKEPLKIRVAYERALTLLRKGDTKEARKAIADARDTWKEKLDKDLYGMALPILEAESHIVDAQKTNDAAAKEKGVAILRSLHERPNPWPMIVQWVMEGLLGKTTEPENLDPFQLWIMANDALAKAQDGKDQKEMETALDLFKKYGDKAGPQDKNYTAALYSQAACLLQLTRKAEAADLFRKVADEAPAYQYAPAAAKYNVSLRGEIYEGAATDENRSAYEDSLKWFLAKWLQTDPEQQYFYGLILFRGQKYTEAADAFTRVPEKAEHYPDSRYWVPLCHLEQLREKILPTRDKPLILSRARVVAQELLAFADYAAHAKGLPEEKQGQLKDWSEAAYINAADIYLYNEVELPTDAIPILDAMEQKFTLDEDLRGRVLKLRIDALQKLNRLDDAQQVLTKFLQVAKEPDVGPVLRGLFKALTDDVRELIRRGQKDIAAAKVEQAKVLGDRLREWLEKSSLPDRALQVENTRYDLGELYLAVGNYVGAQTLYQEIGGPKPEEIRKGPDGKPVPLKEDCISGLARAYEGLGGQAPDAAQAKAHFERALELWRVLVQIAESERGGDRNAVWDRRYHLCYCKFRLGEKKEVRDALKALQVLSGQEPFGGKDAVTQKKFRELLAQVEQAP